VIYGVGRINGFWTLMCLSRPLTFISHFKVYQVSVLVQSSVCNVILSMVTLLLTLNLCQQPIPSVRESHVPCITLEAFFISISIIFVSCISHSFAWQPVLLDSLWLSWHYVDLLKLYTMFNYSIHIKVIMSRVSIMYWSHLPIQCLWNNVEA